MQAHFRYALVNSLTKSRFFPCVIIRTILCNVKR